jgi:glucosamine-6-phosphate deaminase
MQKISHPEILNIVVFLTKAQTAKMSAKQIIDVVRKNPRAAITYATGETMVPVYEELAKAVRAREVDFSQTKAFHLDEYYPCSPDKKISFVKFLYERVFNPLNISESNINILDGSAQDGAGEAKRYDDLVSKGIDLVILGIGPGEHIGFNERNTPFDSRTHLAQLSDETVNRDQVERKQDTPDKALTQGIGTILEAKSILMIAYGKNKGVYLNNALYGEINPNSPASALRLVGDKVSVIIDESAADVLNT